MMGGVLEPERTVGGMSPREVTRLVYDYIGVEGGHLGDFSYRTLEEFYPRYCNLAINPFEVLFRVRLAHRDGYGPVLSLPVGAAEPKQYSTRRGPSGKAGSWGGGLVEADTDIVEEAVELLLRPEDLRSGRVRQFMGWVIVGTPCLE
jgi:hypothetical protein